MRGYRKEQSVKQKKTKKIVIVSHCLGHLPVGSEGDKRAVTLNLFLSGGEWTIRELSF
jgi:tRNA A37 threonylcarbamoyltransferase TsaD